MNEPVSEGHEGVQLPSCDAESGQNHSHPDNQQRHLVVLRAHCRRVPLFAGTFGAVIDGIAATLVVVVDDTPVSRKQ